MNEKKDKVKINLAQYVHDHIMEMLIRQEIKPGGKVPEEKISEMLNVSRTPIREAIRILAAEGMVNISPNRVAEVISFTKEDIHDIGMVRLSNDLLAGKLAIYNGSNADFQRLAEIADMCEEYAKQGDIFNRIIFDAHFHNELAEIAGNPILLRFQKELYQRICFYQSIEYARPGFKKENISHHDPIIRALMNRNEAEYSKAIQEHLIEFYDLRNSKYKVFLNEDN
ncbi:MAG: GntR family transcriptional regulator [Christensenella sp.]|uniref:GntR family transcriptional regulator n=1 Tax=Christensenella sp. TaxID=1935934 RepID=UPI002B212535|nr:GntR family transcriptional regulator [Christensenella sp.]MEA5002333.1 GntR family transcriptional regulator [Christensenella sp.]